MCAVAIDSHFTDFHMMLFVNSFLVKVCFIWPISFTELVPEGLCY